MPPQPGSPSAAPRAPADSLAHETAALPLSRTNQTPCRQPNAFWIVFHGRFTSRCGCVRPITAAIPREMGEDERSRRGIWASREGSSSPRLHSRAVRHSDGGLLTTLHRMKPTAIRPRTPTMSPEPEETGIASSEAQSLEAACFHRGSPPLTS